MEFKATMFLPSTTISSGLLCPDQRRMPQIGSLFAEIFAMGILIVRLPLVVVVSSPVLMDLLTGPCYLNAMSHSLLMNCGQELFSLEEFFESAYACNKYFWGIFAVIGNFLPAGFAQTFLNGMAAVGENSGASAFMPGIIGAFSKITANDPSEGATNAQNLVTGSVSRFGPTAMFMKTALNPIAGAHWIWRVASRMTVQIMQATKAQRSIGSVFWNVLYDGRVDYENLVAKRMFNTCGGLALMAGYTSPLGNVILHYCFAGVKSTIATLNLLSVFFVDLPIIVCVCRQTSGNNPADWILHNCDSPDGLKPLLRTIMDNPHMCAEFVNRTNTNLTTVFDDTLGELFAGTNTVGSVLDSLLAAVDGSKAGQCDNFNSNPYVVTLIPEPADYWRVCGNTDFCRLRCKQQMEAFELVRPSFLRSTTSTQTTQSLFFPAITADAYNQFSSTGVIALSELESCASVCPAAEDRCFLLGGFASAAILRAVQYCVPSALAQGVGKSGQWDTMGISGQSVDIKFIRIGIEGGWQDTYAFVGMQDSLVQICGKLDCKEFPAADVGVLGFQQMQVLGDIAVFQVSTEEEGSTSWCLSFVGSEWSFYPCPSTNVWDQDLYHIVTTASSKAILLPYDNVPLQICQLQSAILSNCVQYVGFDRQNVPVKTRGIQSRVSQFVSTEYSIFVATNEASHWLTMLFVTISGPFASGMIGNSMPVTVQYTLQQSCSLDSCTGCVQLSVQRLCFAAQQCQVARCVGSQVNQLRPLCAIGGIVEAQFFALLAGLHGVWSMISSTLVFIIDAAGGINPPKNVAWPDQAFYGLVCSLKDSYASMVSVFTSAINGVVQSSMPSTMLAHGETVDNRFLATFTLTMTAVTNFLYQLTLGPLYAAIAMQKIMVCQTNSLIAAISDNNAVTIGDPAIQTASGVAAGVCMSQMHTENAQASNSGVDTNKAFVSGSIQVLSRLGGLALQLPLDQLIHPIDVMFTYMLGVTMGLQDVLETADQKNCRAPDWTTRVLYKCPCGDQPVSIPDYRQVETYQHGAYWCSTVMAMIDFDGSTKYVWNPYSLAQLKVKLNDFDAYLECVASKNDASCTAPTDPIFQKQQIPLLSVYQRCLSNYQAQTWDQGSFVMFNQSLQKRLRLDTVPMPSNIDDTFNVSVCLLQQKALGNDNVGCLVDYFLKGSQAIDFFEYSNITDTDSPGSAQIDACLTFSGPAASSVPSISQPFTACLESSANRSGCDIPHMLWSGRSTNRIPVASQHALNVSDDAKRQQWSQGEMDAAQQTVLSTLDKIEKEWTGSGLDITIFSADGDLVHQFADCVMMGPMGATTLTPGPDDVEKVIWSRSSTGASTREFEVPCTGKMLENRNGERDNMPPFTCGTYARRAAMKYFLRNKYGGMKSNPGARQAVVEVVKTLINETRKAWSMPSNFMCTCPNGSATGWECCKLQKNCATVPCPCPEGSSSVACCPFVCGGLAGTGLKAPFSYINGTQVANDLMTSLGKYLQNDVWTSTAPWLLHDPQGADAYRSSWDKSRFKVASAGLFDASNPVVYYDEIFYPFRSTFWEHCTGLLQQVIWTLPLDRSTGKPKGMPSEYDPINGQSLSPNLTYIEDFIQSLTQAAYIDSPIYWHYNVRHTPSMSEICRRTTSRKPPSATTTFPVTGTNYAAMFGFSSMTLGGLGGADCYCGWWWTNTSCRIPDSLCGSLVQILGFTRICTEQNQVYNMSDHLTVLAAIQTLVSRISTVYPCPSLQISDHWGFFDPSTGQPFKNATAMILDEGVGGFRVGNTDWLFASQAELLNPSSRILTPETLTTNAALKCNESNNPSIADLFIDELFPSAQGVRQSMPQSYCVRYGIELARLTVYEAAGLHDAANQQQGVVSTWRIRCQYKLEELAVCNSFRVFNATGGPQDASKCPYTLSVTQSLQNSYAVTPGCLLVVWNSQQDGIYDPCICVPCTKNPNIDVPAQLTSICRLEAFQRLVADDVIPGETTGVPLGSGSFRALMDKPGLLQINTPDIAHWALHTNMRDADLTLDWWPDEWKQPVGYHVTPGCSTPGDAHWKTFDASWRWDSKLEQMVFARDETNDPLLSRNAFGASGVCRTNNYGMPLTMLNSMAVCTQENADAKADPMVPSGAPKKPWVDGSENCAPDAFSTPWGVDRTLNPPRQWTVGTLQQEASLSPFAATEWGQGCGPYPLSTCTLDNDCAAGLACIIAPGGAATGVCGVLQGGKMECATHSTCSSNRMCSGDGICVQGVWQIQNNIQQAVSFRSYSQSCETGIALDTWGTSIAENLPDILNASGLCSYRSWFENRRMSVRNWCNGSNTCEFSGMQPWNFSAPNRQQDAGKSAFDSGVLVLQPSQCDRDYQFYQGFSSCTPNDAMMFDSKGNPIQGPYKKDNRTITYRQAGKRVPLMNYYADELKGPSFGFTGIPMTYEQLGLGSATPSIVACVSQHICGFQPIFMVNNQQVDHRLVLDDGVTRGYTLQDLLACGSFGMLKGSMCYLDFAVVPLASFVLTNRGTLYSKRGFPDSVKTKLTTSYTSDEKYDMLPILQMLPDLVIAFYIGGEATTLQEYVSMTNAFIAVYDALGQINKPTYTPAGIPNQIYNVTMFGAYEVPFAWWYKCTWLGGHAMGNDPIDAQLCSWQGGQSQPTAFSPSSFLQTLFQISQEQQQETEKTTLLQQLINIPGVITQEIIDQAYTDYVQQRDGWFDRLGSNLQSVHRRCKDKKMYVPFYSAQSEAYQIARLNQMYYDIPFDLSSVVYTDINNRTVCTGSACLTSTGDTIPFSTDLPMTLVDKLKEAAVNKLAMGLSDTEVPKLAGAVLVPLFSSEPIPVTFWDGLLDTFKPLASGCSGIVTLRTSGVATSCLCGIWSDCSNKVKNDILQRAKITTQPSSTTIPEIILGSTRIDTCVVAGIDSIGKCFLDNGVLQSNVNFTTVASVTVPAGVSAELYMEVKWDCKRLTCDSNNIAMDGKMVPAAQIPFTVTNQETLLIQEYTFMQRIGFVKTNPWESLATQINEINCDEENRFKKGRDQWGNTQDQCKIEERKVEASPTFFEMKVRTLKYYINETLRADLEFLPCVVNFDPGLVTAETFLNTYNTYRNDPIQFSDCARNNFTDSNGMPNLDVSLLRRGTSATYSSNSLTKEAILKMVQSAIARGNQQIVRPTCMNISKQCLISTSTLQGTVEKLQWSDSQNKEKCRTLKNDALYGCIMWPGENTDRYYALPGTALHNSITNSWNPTMDFSKLQFPQCMRDSSDDPCRSEEITLRDMWLRGQTFTYIMTSTNPTCTAGPTTQCTLLDEVDKLGSSPQAACPGTDSSQQRNRDYYKLVQNTGGLNTNFILRQALGNNLLSESGIDFNHMFITLDPNYQCCRKEENCRAQCSAPNEIPVEMKRNLWKCLQCPLVSEIQCTGIHNCLITSPSIAVDRLNTLPGWNNLTSAQAAFLTSTASSIEVVVPALRWLATQVSTLWTSGVRLSYSVPQFMQSFTGSYEYNPISIASYDATMQVNARTCTETGTMPDFVNCSYDTHRRELRQFVESKYKVNDGIIINPKETLLWRVGRAQMMSQNIPQWESIVNRTELFLVDLFSDKWCTKGNIMDNACYVTSVDGKPVIRALNPGLLGEFEPSVGCDTQIINQQRVIYSYCSDCSVAQTEYDTLEDGYTMTCPKTYTAVKQITADSSAKSNLCSKTPSKMEDYSASSCGNKHGILGGTNDGKPVGSLYTRQPWPGGLPSGLRNNPLLRGTTTTVDNPSNIALTSGDIGGHYIRMVLNTATRSGGFVLSVQGLPLMSYASALSPETYGLGVSSSSPKWTQINTALETYKLNSLYPNSVCSTWDCPLRRRAFYMGMDETFRPSVPDPLRSQIMYGTRVHPTQAATPLPTLISQTANRVLSVYSSSNGFCACQTPPCVGCSPDTAALYGSWTNAEVVSSAVCSEQIDWPYPGGKLRDGSEFNQRWATKTSCGLLDRLPTFRYRYANLQKTIPSTKTTLDKGGVCHMGWPAITAGPMVGCYILVDTDSYMCPSFTQPKTVNRMRAKTVAELLAASTRPQLKDCSAPPSYRINGTVPVAPEVSYGQLKRWEAARLLANDLRRRLCGNSVECKPSSQWSLSTFWSSVFMANFPSSIPSGNGANESLWSQPWVACIQEKNGSQTCDKTISRSDWIASNRSDTCMATITSSKLASELVQDINVCDLDSTMDLFCRTVQNARYRVFEANCLYSGQCRHKLFFYQPSTYEIDNGEFVRNTVQKFYNDSVAGACIPDQDTAAAIQANAENLKKCAAMQLNVLVHCIQIVRIIVGTLVELLYYSGEVMLYVFQLLGAKTDEEKLQITTQINALLALIQNKCIALMREVGDLFYSIIFDGPMGAWLISLIQSICEFMDWLFSEIVYVFLCWVRAASIWFLESFAQGFVDVLNKMLFNALGGVSADIARAVVVIKQNIPCGEQKTLWKCDPLFLNNNATISILPMPTRCWAGAEPQVGGSLACSAADTCIQQGDFSNVICGACPVASSMTRFGCDTLTKLCSCNVFPIGITSCASHEECTMDNADVSCQYVDSYLQPSYGNVPCSRCPNPICLITDGSGVGTCSCLLRAVPLQTCSGVGKLVSPDAGSLCLVATAGSGHLASSNLYSANYRTLVSVPCMLLNQAQSWCYNVFTSASVSNQLVVGLALLSTGRRRLLQVPNNYNNGTFWDGRGEPCRSLVGADITGLGILEKYTRGECWRWYEIGLRLTFEANMTGVSPFLLVSWRDMVDALLDKRSLTEIMAKIPFVIHRILLHSEFTQPIYVMTAYWTNVIPKYFWENQTILDSAREYLFNASSPNSRRLLADDGATGRHLMTESIHTDVSAEAAYQWSLGPYSWPPNYVYWNNGGSSCAIVSTGLDVIKNGLDATATFYNSQAPDPEPVSWPELHLRTPEISFQNLSLGDFMLTTRTVLSNLTDAWLDRVHIRALLVNASYVPLVKHIIMCNFTHVQTCAGRKSLFWSGVQALVIVIVVGAVSRILGIPYIEIILAFFFVPLILYLAYGYSPMCAPLVPVCLLPDLYSLADWIFPSSLVWPTSLITANGPANCADKSCMRSCVSDPTVGYDSVYDHAAWIMCEASASAVKTALTMTNGDPLRTAVLRKCVDTSDSMRSAQRICFAVTVMSNLPILLIVFTALWILPSALAIVSAVFQAGVNMVFTFILFLHSSDHH